jgi:hypothetical protein
MGEAERCLKPPIKARADGKRQALNGSFYHVVDRCELSFNGLNISDVLNPLNVLNDLNAVMFLLVHR